MKKIIMALAILGITYSGAEAQAKKCTCKTKKVMTKQVAHVAARPHTTKRTKAYQVCRNEGGYYVCCVHNKTITTKTLE